MGRYKPLDFRGIPKPLTRRQIERIERRLQERGGYDEREAKKLAKEVARRAAEDNAGPATRIFREQHHQSVLRAIARWGILVSA